MYLERGRRSATTVVVTGVAALVLAGCTSSSKPAASPASSHPVTAAPSDVATASASGLASTAPASAGAASSASTGSSAASTVAGFTLAPYIKADVASGKRLHFVYITNDLSSSYTASQKTGVEKAASQLGVNAELQGPPTGAAQDQVSLIQTLVAQKAVDGIAVAAVNVDSLKPVIQEAFDAGIPFISVFTDQPNSKQLAFVGADNEAFGKSEGEQLAKLLVGKTGRVVAVSVDTAAGWSTSRVAGLKAGLASNPGLTVVGPVNTGIEPGQMFNTIQNTMVANPGALAIASVDCCSIDGAAKWAQSSGNSGKVIVIGTDALKQTTTYILGGTIAFSISQNPVLQVVTAITELNDFVAHGVPPKTVIVTPLLVDKSNAATVTPEG